MAWFKWHDSTVTDAKIQCVAKKSGQPVAFVVAVWAMLLERASQADERGSIDGFDCESADAALQLPDGAACAILEAMRAKCMLEDRRIAKWEQRQGGRRSAPGVGVKSNAERQREYRARQRQAETAAADAAVTERNEDVTESNATVTESNAALCNVTESNATVTAVTALKDKIRLDKNIKSINSASPGDAAHSHPAESGQKKPPEGYRTKKGRILSGKRLESFTRFWQVFDFPKGKAEAADAWLDIPELTDSLVNRICAAAELEARARPELERRGQTPKWPQGWLSGRRWEDYDQACGPGQNAPARQGASLPEPLTAEEQAKARATRERLAAERKGRPFGVTREEFEKVLEKRKSLAKATSMDAAEAAP